MNALIFAAGLGTRLGVFTKDTPKALVEVCGKPMLEHQLLHLKKAGANVVVINVHHFADRIADFILKNNSFGMDIRISDESDMLLDTGGGLRKALPLFDNDKPVLLHNADIFSSIDLKRLYNSHIEMQNDVTMVVADRDTTRKLYFNENGILKGWRNSVDGKERSIFADFNYLKCKPFAFQGVHVVSQTVLKYLNMVTEEKFGITGFYIDYADRLQISAMEDPNPFCWVDAGKPEMLSKAADIVSAYYQ